MAGERFRKLSFNVPVQTSQTRVINHCEVLPPVQGKAHVHVRYDGKDVA